MSRVHIGGGGIGDFVLGQTVCQRFCDLSFCLPWSAMDTNSRVVWCSVSYFFTTSPLSLQHWLDIVGVCSALILCTCYNILLTV